MISFYDPETFEWNADTHEGPFHEKKIIGSDIYECAVNDLFFFVAPQKPFSILIELSLVCLLFIIIIYFILFYIFIKST